MEVVLQGESNNVFLVMNAQALFSERMTETKIHSRLQLCFSTLASISYQCDHFHWAIMINLFNSTTASLFFLTSGSSKRIDNMIMHSF